jgi:peptidoglycan hydrolase CwlO-like protein
MKEIIIILFTAGAGSFFGWFFTKRKQNVEITGAEIDNDTKVIELWKGWSEHLQKEIDSMSNKIELLTKRIEELETENREHLQTIEKLLQKSHGKNIKSH